jgi:2-haloacid dehalogenase
MRVIAFDVNETLLDLRGLDGAFQDVFGSTALRGQWFALMLQLSFVGGLTGEYVDFTTAQHAALRMLAEREGVAVTDEQADALVGGMTMLPAHADVAAALTRIASSPLHVVALTNSPLAVAEAQLTNAGVRHHFERVMSADTVRSLKPTRAPYLAVAQAFDVAPVDVRLVAAHSWDVSGALAAGCHAAFVGRPGMVMSSIGPRPDIVGADVAAVVDRILATDV